MGLTGDLGELPLADLVEMTSVGGKTGRLALFDEEGVVAGVLTFRGGRVVGAHAGDLAADKAFYALLALKTGSFDFDPAAELGEDEVSLPTESLLIEGMRRLDEMYRMRRRLPAATLVRRVGGEPGSPLEERALARLDSGPRTVGELVESILAGGDADEYDALKTLSGLWARHVVQVELSPETPRDAEAGRSPQP